jgi:hypothetical protein
MPKPSTVLDVEIEASITGAIDALPGYDDADIIPGKGIIFRMHEDDTPASEVLDTYVLPWHAFDGVHLRRIPRKQYEATIKAPEPVYERWPCANMPATQADVPKCFGTYDLNACNLCVISGGCKGETDIRAAARKPVCFGDRTADGPECQACGDLTACMLKFQEKIT